MIGFLVSRQKNDGGFSESLKLDPHIEDKWGGIGRDWYPVGKSITWLTGKALEALCSVNFEDTERLRRARDFLLNSQYEDGKALEALCSVNFEDTERLRRARDFLLNSQYEDGNWPDYTDQKISDPLATGNILLGLHAIGVNSKNDIINDGRAALLQHLSDCLELKCIFDLADLTAIGKPKTEKEKEIVQNGVELIASSQKEDGGWAPIGSQKSDPELSSILVLEFKKAIDLL